MAIKKVLYRVDLTGQQPIVDAGRTGRSAIDLVCRLFGDMLIVFIPRECVAVWPVDLV